MEHAWFIKRQVFLLFDEGKELEARAASRLTEGVSEGDIIVFNNKVRRRVAAIRVYRSFGEMLKNEDPKRLAPGILRQQIVEFLRKTYTAEQERRGVYVYELAEAA